MVPVNRIAAIQVEQGLEKERNTQSILKRQALEVVEGIDPAKEQEAKAEEANSISAGF